MRALIQRVSSASVSVDGKVCGKCEEGLLIFLGVGNSDTENEIKLLADKLLKLRIFHDGEGKMNRSITDIGGQALIISQFTLYADYSHGNRPNFLMAAKPEIANEYYEKFCDYMAQNLKSVGRGIFGAEMHVELANEGPVTILVDTDNFGKKTAL
ncbi:MAG: D-tyrosyl-tRNA(Tyr) deacylase [Clostridia bacterium]|nr:D-tyrosyl-tRNA(Tyr) deacylase [Clostridia bacterium]